MVGIDDSLLEGRGGLNRRESAQWDSRSDTRRFIKILVAVLILLAVLVAALYFWNEHRRARFIELSDQRMGREVFREQLGEPDSIGNFAGEECWHFDFNRNPYALVCFGAEMGEFLHSGHFFID